MLKRVFSICLTGRHSKVCTVIGSQWGDEGKGKLVDILARDYDMVGRFNGGANAGHTIVVGGQKFAFHLLPCGVLYPDTMNIIGNGIVLHIPSLLDEIKYVEAAGYDIKKSIYISDRCHLVTSGHLAADGAQESSLGDQQIGTTKKGIGPAYMTKMLRNGLRAGDLLHMHTFEDKYHKLTDFLERAFNIEVDRETELQGFKQYSAELKEMIHDTIYIVNSSLAQNKRLICEGANALMLDIDYGSYPYVTSSHTGSAGIPGGLGVPPSAIETVIGVVKAYTTRVGAGPFPTEILGGIGDYLQQKGHEIGVTTGRKRRCGWLDLNVVRYTHMLNNYSSLNITKLDVLDELSEIKIGVGYQLKGAEYRSMPANLENLSEIEVIYETLQGWQSDTTACRTWNELPANAKRYLERVSTLLKVPVSWVGTGPSREQMLLNPSFS